VQSLKIFPVVEFWNFRVCLHFDEESLQGLCIEKCYEDFSHKGIVSIARFSYPSLFICLLSVI
jgi:hypothetical protein